MRRTFLAFLILTLSISQGITRDIHFQKLGIIHGLSQSSAISLWQDPLGRMWMGNDVLNCYDGEKVKIHRLSEHFKEVEDANIHTITGNQSVLFAIAENHLIQMDLATETFHLTGIQTLSVYCSEEYAYFFEKGYFKEYDWRKKQVRSVLPLDVTTVRDIFSAGNGAFWLATPQGIFIVDINTQTIVRKMLENEDVCKLYKDSQNDIWMITRSRNIYTTRLGSYVPQLLSFTFDKEYPRFTDILCIQEDIKGSIWLGTLSGLYQIKQEYGSPTKVSFQNYVIPEANIYSLFSDRQGTLWIGSYYGDVRYFNPEVDNYIFFATDENHPERLHGAVIGTIAEDEERNIYIATEGSGINILEAGTSKFKHLKWEDGLLQNKIRYIWYDKSYQHLYICGYMQGISYYDTQRKQIFHIDNGILKSRFQRIVEEMLPYQQYLVLRTQDGLFKLDRNSLHISPMFEDSVLQEYCSGIIRAYHIDKNQKLWISSFEKGLFTIDLKKNAIIQSYGDGLTNKDFISSAVVDICEDPQKGIFMATLNSGVLTYNAQTNTFDQYSERNKELLSDICYNICFSWYDNLIVTTNRGISIINFNSRKQINSVHHIALSPSFPLIALSGDCGIHSSIYSDKIYIGGLYGLISFSEKDLVMDKSDYSLYFSSLHINSVPVYSPSDILPKQLPFCKKIILDHDQNTINLNFACTNYLSTQNTTFEYKLEGVDEHWNITSHKQITYNSLQPGKYKLLVRETSHMNKQAELEIIIKSPSWSTIPAILGYLLIITFITLFIVRFFKSKTLLKASLESKKEEMERMEELNQNKVYFFINIFNEFRTPLTLILSQLERLIQEPVQANRKKLDRIKSQALRLQDLIAELHDLGKIEENKLPLQIDNIDLKQFLRNIYLTYFDYANEKQINYRFTHPNKLVSAWIDTKQFQKVVYNLLNFVFKFGSKKELVTLTLLERSNRLETTINYQGELPEKTKYESLFQALNNNNNYIPDFTLIPEGGMSLIFSKGIIKLHKGDLIVKADEKNLLFTITLKSGNSHFSPADFKNNVLETGSPPVPVSSYDIPDNFIIGPDFEEEVVADSENETKSFHMLLVEDNNEVRGLLKEIFSFNYNVVEMTNTTDAYQYAIDEKPDIIVCEVMLPDIGGIALCKKLKNNIQTLHIPVILLTSQPSEKQHIECIRSGADDYIVKPFNIDILILRCNYLVKQSKKLSESQKIHKPDEILREVPTNIRDRNFLALAQKVVEENMANPDFDTLVWSKQLGIGRTRLFSLIKNITGKTPNDYILHMKLNKSLVLLAEHTLTIGEIAYQLGFSSPAYFSKCFKKQFGLTPADYRKKL